MIVNNPKDTRSRALKLGNHLLQTRGYNGFSFQDIADSLGIRKASLHYYFASKEELGLAVVQHHHEYFANFAKAHLKTSSTKKLEKLVQFFYTMSKDHRKVCPLGALCIDHQGLSKKVLKSLAEFHLMERKWLINTFKEGIAKKEFKKNLDPTMAADIFLASIQGGLQLARLQGSSENFKKSLRGLLRAFSSR